MVEKRQLLRIGHRGAMGHAPENTLLSVQTALELGVHAIEVDVYGVGGHLMVFHDDRLERTTDGEGYLSAHSYAQLRALNAGAGQRIPTLEEVCNVACGRACINIELKGVNTAEPVLELVEQLVDSGWDKQAFLLSSFNHRELLKARKLDGTILLGALLYGFPVGDARFAEELGCFSVHPSIEFIDQQLVDDAHARNLQVYVYTVNHPDDLERCRNLGVDGVFTDYPERVPGEYLAKAPLSSWSR